MICELSFVQSPEVGFSLVVGEVNAILRQVGQDHKLLQFVAMQMEGLNVVAECQYCDSSMIEAVQGEGHSVRDINRTN